MKVLQIGNLEPPHSTESDLRSALERNGHTVTSLQEQHVDWSNLPSLVEDVEPDWMLWTRTASLDTGDPTVQADSLATIRRWGVPIVGLHLDLFWGLTARRNREHWIADAPYFQHTNLMFTADGNNDDMWEAAHVDHIYLPPAVAMKNVETVGRVNPKFRAQYGFVGSYRDYHPEWQHRKQLVTWMQRNYRTGFKVWEGHIRGQDLADLYATVPILIGDSCMIHPGGKYFSDRIPETLGRGGFLLHPYNGTVEAREQLEEQYPVGTLVTWKAGDMRELKDLLTHYSRQHEERRTIAEAGRQHVIEHHTYERRIEQIIDVMTGRGLL